MTTPTTPTPISPQNTDKEYEHLEKLSKRMDKVWTRILGCLTEEERKDVPHEIISLGGDSSWSPATRDMAINFLKDMIGEDHNSRIERGKRWKKWWKENPEIHF